MNNVFEPGRVDLLAIEIEARRLRAEAVRDWAHALRGWIAGRFGRTNAAAARHA